MCDEGRNCPQQTKAQRLADELCEPIEKCPMPTRLEKEAAAELRRLDAHELANNVWHEKTEWVQDTAQPHELGMHRADVMRQRIERLEAVKAQMLEALEDTTQALCWLAFGECRNITDRPLLKAQEAEAKARAALAAAKGEA